MATSVLGLKTFAASDPVDVNEVNDNYVKIDSAFKKVDAKIEDGKSAVKSELRSEIDVERKRIDNIASLPDGSTSGDAELSDIRIGANGKKYESAGAAVRGQISEIKNDVADLEPLSKAIEINKSTQLIDENAVLFNGYPSGTTFAVSSKHRILQVPCQPNTVYCVSRNSLAGARFQVYTTENPVSVETHIVQSFTTGAMVSPTHEYYTFTTADNANYIAVMFYNGNMDTETVETLLSYLKVEKGNTPTKGVSINTYRHTKEFIGDMPVMTESVTVCVGEEKYGTGSINLDGGWSVVDDKYTKPANETSSMSVNVPDRIIGSIYLVEFDTDFTTGEFMRARMGEGNGILVYNGSGHITLPLRCNGNGNVTFTPVDEGIPASFSIWNISIKRIQPSGDKVTLMIKSVMTDNHKENFGFWNVLLGENVMNASGTTRTIAIGNYALRDLEGGHRNVAIGTFVMSQLKKGEANVVIGADAMLETKYADKNVVIGCWALYNAQTVEESIAIGQYAMYLAEKSQKNLAIGQKAGFNTNAQAENNAQSNVYIGYEAGYRNRLGSGNTSIGASAFGGNGGNFNTNIGYNSQYETGCEDATVIGANAKATKSHQMVLGTPTTTEVVLGNKKINFNEDGSVTWESV